MKHHLLLTFLTLSFVGASQITVTNSIFPQAGKVLKTSTTTDYNNTYSISPASAQAQTWDFSALTSNFPTEDSIKAASSGGAYGQFPNTEILRPLLSLGTSYVDVTSSVMRTEGAGIEFPDFGGGIISFIAPFSDPIKIQKAPLNYGTSYSDNFELFLSEHIDSIPGLRALIDSLNPVSTSPDSIRLNLSGTKTANVDAFGSLTSTDSTYDVLRQKVTRYTNTQVEVYVSVFSIGSWIDITSTLTNALPIPVSDTAIYYDHIAEGYAEPIVRCNMDNSGNNITSISFKGENASSSVGLETNKLEEISVYPNPAATTVTIQFNSSRDKYNAVITDMKGRQVAEYNQLLGSKNQINVSDLSSGVYQLVLTSAKGKMLSSKRLVVQK